MCSTCLRTYKLSAIIPKNSYRYALTPTNRPTHKMLRAVRKVPTTYVPTYATTAKT